MCECVCLFICMCLFISNKLKGLLNPNVIHDVFFTFKRRGSESF